MAATDKEVFQTVITAKDDSASVLAAVEKRYEHLGKEVDHVGHSIEHMHKPHMFAELNEHISLTREHFGELHATVGEVGASLVDLLPALAALGAAGTIAGLFETAEHVAESYATLAHSAVSLGMTTAQLQQLGAVATLTDTNVEGMQKSMSRLNFVIAESVSGHNKQAAAAFASVGISLRDSNHHVRSAIDILPQLADAFQKTGSITAKTQAARGFFGKGGVEMIPLMSKGGKYVDKYMEETKGLTFDFTPYAGGLEQYNEDMKKLQLATHSFTDELGAKLAPALRPVVDLTEHWVKANQDWITTGMTAKVTELSNWLQKVDWEAAGMKIDQWGKRVETFVDAIGGAKIAVEGLAGIMALRTLIFLAEPLLQVGRFGVAITLLGGKILGLAAKWDVVGAHAAAAEAAAIAPAIGAGAVAGGHGALGASIAAESSAIAAGQTVLPSGRASVVSVDLRRSAAAAAASARFQQTLAARVAAMVGGYAYLAWDASNSDFALDKEFVREHPVFARDMTRKQFNALPEHSEHVASMLESLSGVPMNDPGNPDWLERRANNLSSFRNDLFGAPLAASSGDSRLPFKVEGAIDTTITINGLPPGASISSSTRTSGAVRPPSIVSGDDLGSAFADRFGIH